MEVELLTCLRSQMEKALRQRKVSQWAAWESGCTGKVEHKSRAMWRWGKEMGTEMWREEKMKEETYLPEALREKDREVFVPSRTGDGGGGVRGGRGGL